MNKKLIWMLCGIILILGVGAFADEIISLSEKQIDYGDDKQAIIDAGLDDYIAGEVKCNLNNCYVRVDWANRNDYVAINGVNVNSNEKDIETARDEALIKWATNKAKLINEANLKRNARGTEQDKLDKERITPI